MWSPQQALVPSLSLSSAGFVPLGARARLGWAGREWHGMRSGRAGAGAVLEQGLCGSRGRLCRRVAVAVQEQRLCGSNGCVRAGGGCPGAGAAVQEQGVCRSRGQLCKSRVRLCGSRAGGGWEFAEGGLFL